MFTPGIINRLVSEDALSGLEAYQIYTLALNHVGISSICFLAYVWVLICVTFIVKQDLVTMQHIAWNKLPEDLRLALTLTTFETRLKTFMFALAFC